MLKQTTEVKTQPFAHITQFHNSQLVMSQTVTDSRGPCTDTDHSICHLWR